MISMQYCLMSLIIVCSCNIIITIIIIIINVIFIIIIIIIINYYYYHLRAQELLLGIIVSKTPSRSQCFVIECTYISYSLIAYRALKFEYRKVSS